MVIRADLTVLTLYQYPIMPWPEHIMVYSEYNA